MHGFGIMRRFLGVRMYDISEIVLVITYMVHMKLLRAVYVNFDGKDVRPVDKDADL